MNQTAQIRKHLNSGRSLTAIQALNNFGCFRLAARIFDLRSEYGEESIYTEKQPHGESYIAVYHGTDLLKGRKAA